MDYDVAASIGAEDWKILLYDDFDLYSKGEYIISKNKKQESLEYVGSSKGSHREIKDLCFSLTTRCGEKRFE